MPRYFFHVMDGKALIDEEGVDLPDINAARKQAIRTAGEILADGEASGHLMAEFPWQMTVVDDERRTVFTLAFQARSYL